MNRRNRLRFSTDMIATITGIDDPDVSMKGRLQNLSAHGISLIVPGELPTGIAVRVQWGTSGVRGTLVYCRPFGDEYQAGLEVEDPIYEATLARGEDKKTGGPGLKMPGE
ncbi:MAG: PilZ domain-containing protein [Acidobacteria bacterium]|nr:PilZ domain-containing protein [Acidobacteriota bacterium]